MIINACEATQIGKTIKIWTEEQNNFISFCVWNDSEIPKDISLRIFQRNFSTKNKVGRGIGTYSMKHFGETILGGKVNFVTSKFDGTTFSFTLPKKSATI